MIAALIRWSAQNLFLTLLATLVLAAAGAYAVSRIPLDAIPDLSDTQVIVYTEFPGQAPQVVEDQVTYPLSSALLSVPRSRVVREGWRNVWHACASAETIALPQPADAVLFNYVHDILRTPAAVNNIMSQVRPGAHVAVAGMKYFPWWTGPLNLLPWLKNRPYNAAPADLWQPWDLIEHWCDGFARTSTQWGMGYIAHGQRKQEPPSS